MIELDPSDPRAQAATPSGLSDVCLMGRAEIRAVTVYPSWLVVGGVEARRGDASIGHYGPGAVFSVTPHQHVYPWGGGACACGADAPARPEAEANADEGAGEEEIPW